MPPTPAFAGAALDITAVEAGTVFGRIHRRTYPDPLSFGKKPSRFSDPRRRTAARRFGVLYVGSSVKVCFLEAIVRDERDGTFGAIEISEAELDDRLYAEIRLAEPLRLLDLRGDGPVRMGIPSDVCRGSQQGLARKWSVEFYEHPSSVDGILYPSRLNGEINLAIYDRSVCKLELLREHGLLRAPGMAQVLNDLFVALV